MRDISLWVFCHRCLNKQNKNGHDKKQNMFGGICIKNIIFVLQGQCYAVHCNMNRSCN